MTFGVTTHAALSARDRVVVVDEKAREIEREMFEGDHTAVVCSGPLDAEPQTLTYRKTS